MTLIRQMALVLAFLALPLAAGAQQPAQQPGAVRGTLTNSLSGDPAADATVVLESTTLNRQTRSGPDGTYTIPSVPPGNYHLLVSLDGYLPSRTEVRVANAVVTADVRIDPELHFSEVTSVSPTATNQFETFQATNVLGGQELTKSLQGTLGATLENQPGIALRSFGPGPARPVIRGLDGDRVLIVENGLRMGDLSSQSGDHGVNVNPASASSIEVVRGPATLLFGANAIGGLVNVISSDIPTAPVTKASGSFALDAGSAAGVAGGAADITVGTGKVALHLGGSGRRAGDFTNPEGKVPNSFSKAGFGQVGLAYTSDRGYFGASYAQDRTRYGIPFVEDGQTSLNPRRQTFTVRGESRKMTGLFDGVRASFGIRRYKHDELDADVVATSFVNDTSELQLLGHHRQFGRMKGSIGGSFLTRDFSALGAEVLSPKVDQKGGALYLYEEVTATPHVKVQFGGRVDRAAFTPQGAEPARDFTNASASLGLLLLPTDRVTVAFSLARASRNPALEELYFHGPHPGNNAVENGNPDLQSEQSLGFDASLRWRSAVASGEVTFFVNSVDNFIYRQLTGVVDEQARLPETVFAQGAGRLQGIESHADFNVGGLVWVEGGLDYVQGELTSPATPMPRIPPLRGRAGVRLQKNAFQAGVDGVFTATQDRIYSVSDRGVAVGETATEGYNVMKLFTSYSFTSGGVLSTITARLDNATNALYRNHLNYLKDLTPEMGRDFRVVYSVKF